VTTRRILLADADAFYVAVARLVDPDGAGKAKCLIVGGSASGRGVVTSASYEAREYGVRSAMPTAQALRLCPHATVVPVSGEACSEKSQEILHALEDFTPVVEPASIDEFYLDMTGTETLYHHEPLETTAMRIRQAVRDSTGLWVSIGGGTSKLLAKLAAKVAKPRPGQDGTGVHIVPAGDELAFMRTLDLAAIPMIGPKLQERLATFGLKRVEDVLPHDERRLMAWLGKRTGRWLARRVRGLDESVVIPRGKRVSIGHEETFPRDLETDEDLDRELIHLVVRLTGDMRRKGLSARTITIKLRDHDFTTRQASRTFKDAVSTDRTVLDTARKLLARLRTERLAPARLLGVSLSHLTKDPAAGQLSLFDIPSSLETERDKTLARIVDDIGDRYGRRSIVRGSEVTRSKQWER
jgi:DNA polymerase-4